MTARRVAIIAAAALEVCCPACGEAQPNPEDGSHLWSADQLREASGARECAACGAAMTIRPASKAVIA